MRGILKALLLASLLAPCAAACGSGKTEPSQPPPGSITGRERLGWDQQAPHADELREYSWVLYIDGVANALPNATCGALGGEGPSAACVSPLPPLQPGQRTLELATRITAGGSMIESARSAPLVVTVSGSGTASATASATASWSTGGRVPSAPGQPAPTLAGPDAAPYVIEMVVSGLDRPSALAKLPDGRLMIAERGGRIRVADAGVLLAAPAAELADADADGDEGWSLAAAPDFEATRHVFVSYVSRDTGGAQVGRVLRFREAGGTLGERAVILDGLPAHDGTAPRIRFGPDGALYVGTTAVDTRDADDLGSYGGKILRFTATGGAAPGSAVGGSPIISFGHLGPRLEFDWEPGTQGLWSVEAGQRGLLLRRSDPGGSPGGRSAFLEGIQAAGAAFHTAATPAAWRNSLFLASPEDECLYRVSGLDSAAPEAAVERLFARSYGRITAVLSAADGLYFATGNGGRDANGRPADAVFRVSDKAAHPGPPAPRGP